MTDSPSVTCPSPAMTTLSSRRTQRTEVERILRRAVAAAARSAGVATSGFFFMSAIFYYTGHRGLDSHSHIPHRLITGVRVTGDRRGPGNFRSVAWASGARG